MVTSTGGSASCTSPHERLSCIVAVADIALVPAYGGRFLVSFDGPPLIYFGCSLWLELGLILSRKDREARPA